MLFDLIVAPVCNPIKRKKTFYFTCNGVAFTNLYSYLGLFRKYFGSIMLFRTQMLYQLSYAANDVAHEKWLCICFTIFKLLVNTGLSSINEKSKIELLHFRFLQCYSIDNDNPIIY